MKIHDRSKRYIISSLLKGAIAATFGLVASTTLANFNSGGNINCHTLYSCGPICFNVNGSKICRQTCQPHTFCQTYQHNNWKNHPNQPQGFANPGYGHPPGWNGNAQPQGFSTPGYGQVPPGKIHFNK